MLAAKLLYVTIEKNFLLQLVICLDIINNLMCHKGLYFNNGKTKFYRMLYCN